MRLSTFLLLSLLCPAALAAPPDRLRLDLFTSEDSDDSTQQRYALDLAGKLPGEIDQGQWSIGAGSRHFRAEGGTQSFALVRGSATLAPAAGTRIVARAEQLRDSDWSPLLAGVAVTQHIGQRWSTEISADRELVDTVTAIRARNLVTTYAASVDYSVTPAWTLVGAISSQDLRDDNDRAGRSLRVIYAPPDANWNLQTRLRRIDSDFRGAGYFSPRRLEDAMAYAQASWPLAGDRYLVTLRGGGGAQRIDGGDEESIYLAELRGRGWFSAHYGFETRALCSNTGGFNAGPAGDGYRYCEGVLTLIAAW